MPLTASEPRAYRRVVVFGDTALVAADRQRMYFLYMNELRKCRFLRAKQRERKKLAAVRDAICSANSCRCIETIAFPVSKRFNCHLDW